MTEILNLIHDKEANVYVITSNVIPGLVIEHEDKKECIKLALDIGLELIEDNGIEEDD